MVRQRHDQAGDPMAELMSNPAFVLVVQELQEIKAMVARLLSIQGRSGVDAYTSGPAIPLKDYESLEFRGPRKIRCDGNDYDM